MERQRADGLGLSPLRLLLCFAAVLPPLLVPGLGALISLALVLAVLWLVPSSRKPTLDWECGSFGTSVIIGVISAVGISLLMQLAEPLLVRTFGAVDLHSFSAVQGNLANYLILLAVGILFGGLAEELIFRGYIIGWGTKLLGDHAAYPLALFSAAVFGFTHLYQGWGGVVETGSIGLALGVLYVACGRKLLPSIVAHMALNAWGVTQIYLGTA